jgi:hypothetical protein
VVPARVIVVLDQPMKVASTWLVEIRKWMPLKEEQLHKDGKPFVSRISFDNGSEILFLFHETAEMVFESIELSMGVFDEPCPRHIWISLLRGGRTKGKPASYLFVGTPIGGGAWMREELVTPWARGELPDVEVFKYGTVVNEANLAEGYVEQFQRYLTEKEKRVRLLGEFSDLDGLALAHLFSRENHTLPASSHRWPPHYPVIIAIDVAMSKPHVALMMGVDKHDQLVVLKELSLKGTAPEFAAALKNWMAGYRVVDIVADSLGSSDLSGGDGQLSFIASLNKHGIRCRATTYNEKDNESWISVIREVLAIPLEADNFGRREPRLKIVDSCTGLINDIETVSWQKVRNEELYKPVLDIAKKDRLAALKYCLAAQPTHDKGRERVIRSRNGAGLRQTDRALKQLKK